MPVVARVRNPAVDPSHSLGCLVSWPGMNEAGDDGDRGDGSGGGEDDSDDDGAAGGVLYLQCTCSCASINSLGPPVPGGGQGYCFYFGDKKIQIGRGQ